MIIPNKTKDRILIEKLNNLTLHEKDYWSFSGRSRREHGHKYFQYPAMMVPQMIGSILDEICAVHPEIKNIGDPFAGSGTVLTESLFKGLNFTGCDINPLAILLCQSKAGPFLPEDIEKRIKILNHKISLDTKNSIEINFPGIDKWFRTDVQIDLSKIRRVIKKESSLWIRRFLWIALAETARLTCNSRTSTVKLHIRPDVEIIKRNLDSLHLFNRILSRNIEHLKSQTLILKSKGFLNTNGEYKGRTSLNLLNCRDYKIKGSNKWDVIFTSPPYGDNSTTVSYGQYSYLPLQWIDSHDIDPSFDKTYLNSTHEIDYRSLGGSKKVEDNTIDIITNKSISFKKIISAYRKQPKDRLKRISAFIRDLDLCLDQMIFNLQSGGLLVWIIGNRNVGGKSVPLDQIVSELLEYRNASLLINMERRIPTKRMALKNNVSKTISSETIIIMRKGK